MGRKEGTKGRREGKKEGGGREDPIERKGEAMRLMTGVKSGGKEKRRSVREGKEVYCI